MIQYQDPTANPTLDDPRIGDLPMVQIGDIWAVDVRENFPDRRTPTGDMYKVRDPSTVSHLIIHHEAVPYIGRSTIEDLDEIAKIYSNHTQEASRLWPGTGYHFVLSPTTGNLYFCGGVETTRYHATQANPYSVGLCILGLWMADTVYSQELQATFVKRLRMVCENIHKAFGKRLTVVGHKDVGATACPGDWWGPETSNWFNSIPPQGVADPTIKPEDPVGPGDIGLPEELLTPTSAPHTVWHLLPPVVGAGPAPANAAPGATVLQIRAAIQAAQAALETAQELADKL